MYDPLTRSTAIATGAKFLSQIKVQRNPDGLEVQSADQATFSQADIPAAVHELLLDLRVLRQVPLAYYVPDAALLPPESIRFFSVDLTWLDRLIEGVFSAANLGTIDMVTSCVTAGMVRRTLDDEVYLSEKAPQMSGMLIRSELVRRWPNMSVTAWNGTTELDVPRAEPISKDLYIALFAGVPDVVKLGEPAVGTRYGVDNATPAGIEVTRRNPDGSKAKPGPAQPGKPADPVKPLGVSWRDNDAARRVLDIGQLANSVANQSRMVAVHLRQLPYVQVFRAPTTPQDEQKGSRPPTAFKTTNGTIPVRGGRFSMPLDKLNARYQAQQAAKTSKPNP